MTTTMPLLPQTVPWWTSALTALASILTAAFAVEANLIVALVSVLVVRVVVESAARIKGRQPWLRLACRTLFAFGALWVALLTPIVAMTNYAPVTSGVLVVAVVTAFLIEYALLGKAAIELRPDLKPWVDRLMRRTARDLDLEDDTYYRGGDARGGDVRGSDHQPGRQDAP